MKLGCVYELEAPDGKKYIGQTLNFDRRMKEYRWCKPVTKIQKAINKYGWNNFKSIKLLENVPEHDLNALERHTIWLMDTMYPNGYNSATGGCYTKEVRKRMSEAKKGKKRKPFTLEHRKRMSEARRGKKHSKEHKKKMSEAKKGKKRKPFSDHHKRMISENNTGRPKYRRRPTIKGQQTLF